METKKIIEEIANEPFVSSKELKTQAIAIKKTINGIERQKSRLSKYLSPTEMTTLSKAATILEPFILAFNKASKEKERLTNESIASWEKKKIERLESMIVKDFGSFSLNNLLEECKLFITFSEETGNHINLMKDLLRRYDANSIPENLQALKQRLANELDEFTFSTKEQLLAFEAFKARQKSVNKNHEK